MFSLNKETLKQLRTAYKTDDKFNVLFASTFFIVEVEKTIVTFIEIIRTAEQAQGQGIATAFIDHLKEYILQQLVKSKNYSTAFIFVGQSQILKPHKFFAKHGFEPLSEQFRHIKVSGCDMAMFDVQRPDVDSDGSEEQKSARISTANSKVPTANLKKRDQKQLAKEDDGTASVAPSAMSKVTRKTASGAFKRHCKACEFKLIVNWSDHKKKVHGGVEVTFIKCDMNCSQCQDGNVLQQQKPSGQQCEHKVAGCSLCGQTRQVRYLSNGMCAKCAKTESKSVINVATEPLTSHNLNVLPSDVVANEDVKDQLIHKRLHDEYADYVQEDINELIAPQALNKRVKVQQSISDYNQQNGGQEIDTVMKDTTSITDVTASATGMTVTSLLDALDAIEKSTVTDFQASLEVSAICEQFVHQQALTLLKKDSYPRLAALITKILNEQAGQLKQQQLAGLFVAACRLQGPCWTAAVIMLQRRKSDIQQYVLKIFNSYIEVAYGTDIAQWINGHWRNVQEQQLDILKQLKGVYSPVDILFLSLAVQVDDVHEFIKYSSFMLQRDVSVYILQSICKRLTQQRLSVEQFLQLCELVQLDNVTSIIQSNPDIFKSTPLNKWTTKVNELKAISHLINSDTVQDAVGEYIQAYGHIENEFTEDMFNEDSLLGLAMHESFNKASPKQLGLAQYCMGKIRQCQRQLWCVPSGQGKSRIIAFSAAIAVETGMFSAVHISYENETLLNRDKADFESLWLILECVDKIHYHVGCEFSTQEGELVIVDESDTATFNTPNDFIKLVNGRACICFTATPDNCDGKGVEAKVISALKLDVFHYVPDAEVVDAATRLKMDHIQHAESIDAKVSYIQSLVASGPVLVYGTVELKQALTEAVADLIVVDPQVDYSMLRKLDQSPYKILFADSQFGMRGVDYRCERVPMHQVIEQSFSCTRDALQGVARVGRFGDQCTRIIFDGVELVDKLKQLHQSIKLVKYASTAKVNIKQVKVKQAAAPQQRNTGGKNISSRQVQAAQAQTAQQQKFIKIFTKTDK